MLNAWKKAFYKELFTYENMNKMKIQLTYKCQQDSGSVVERNDYYPLGMRTATGNSYPQLATNLYKYNGKEVQTVGGIGFTDYGARMYDDFTGRWFVPDSLAEKYASMSPYMYCSGNPIMFFDLDGRDPIYAKNFWGKIKQIGDDGRNSTGSYLVRGSVARKVRATTKAGYYYTGDLSENKKIMHIPTGQIQQDVQQTALATIRSGDSPETRIESGGHALKGDKSARIWDTGTEMKKETLEDGSVKQWWSVDPFRIGGKKNQIGSRISDIKFIWHIHPYDSKPSNNDKLFIRKLRNFDFTSNSFLIDINNGRVTFFNEKRVLININYDDFKRMGNQEYIK